MNLEPRVCLGIQNLDWVILLGNFQSMTDYAVKKSSAVKSIKRHHPWVFSGAVDALDLNDGDLVRLTSENGEFQGIGYFCKDASIRIRILTFRDEEINQDFWNDRFLKAYELRKSILDFEKTNCFRLINAEGDFVPGLIVDVYGKYAVIDFHTFGLKSFVKEIMLAIEKVGLTPVIIGEDELKIEVLENGNKFIVYPGKGQKTGLFLDQRENRKRLQKYVQGKTVLNMFSYSGGFSIYALKAGAKSVTNVDSSDFAIEQAKKNYELNGLEVRDEDFIVEDAFKYLEKAKEEGLKYDVVILDPPAFVKHKDAIRRALAGYRRLNYLGMKLVADGGILATFSCSGHISNEDLRTIVWQSSFDALTNIQILENPLNQPDHPLNINLTEGEYLKGIFCKVKSEK